jgi:type VI protein secretion system component VasK
MNLFKDVDSALVPCLCVAGGLWLVLLVVIARRSLLTRRRKTVIGVLALLVGLAAVSPVAIAEHDAWSAMAWELAGGIAVGLWVLAFSLMAANAAAHQGTDEDEHARRSRVNPTTGHRMRGSTDAAGYTYGTGRDSFNDRRSDDI